MIEREINSNELLTSNRLDVVFKILYLKFKQLNLNDLADQIYNKHIEIMTNGIFTEPNSQKKTLIDYKEIFKKTFTSIKKEGFNKHISQIPISNDGSITNGSHRLASSIFLNKKVYTTENFERSHNYDYKFFKERGMSINLIELAVLNYIQLSKNNYMAIIWPSADKKIDYLNYFEKVIFEKKITFNVNGAHNFVSQVYREHNWVGSFEDGYNGSIVKVSETFKNYSFLHIVFFENDNFDEVIKLKDKLRNIFKIDKSSVHITDNNQETNDLAKLLLNENSIHFLNHAKPNKYGSVYNKLKKFKNILDSEAINLNEIILAGSTSLGVYGLREINDIDYLSSNPNLLKYGIDNHNSELVHYGKTINELIYNPKHHFYFNGFKFISMESLKKFKLKRDEIKDKLDVLLIEKSNEIDLNFVILKSKNFILKQKYKLISKVIKFTKKNGLYNQAKWLYKKINS
jgi:hypothetical protein